MAAYNRRLESRSPDPLRSPNPDLRLLRSNSVSSNDGTHRHTDRIINKFMERKMEKVPPETHHLVRKQSVFTFVDHAKDKSKEKPKPTNFRKTLKKIRKFNTIIAFVFLILYIGGGAALFWQIESKSDMNFEKYKEELIDKSKKLYKSLAPSKCAPLQPSDNEENNKCLKKIYDLLMDSNPSKHIRTYLDGLAYVLTCITTIGYGQLVCYTIAGKMVTVIYVIIGIALTIYVLRHNGKIALKVCNWALGVVARCIRICGNNKVNVRMTVTKSFILLFVFWILGALGIASYEKFVFWDAIYFSFSTFSTVGFGDLVPTSHVSGAIIFTLHFIDLSLLSMVFVLVHQTMENHYMKVLELLDEGYQKYTTELNTGTTTNLQSPGGSKRNLDMMTTAREKS